MFKLSNSIVETTYDFEGDVDTVIFPVLVDEVKVLNHILDWSRFTNERRCQPIFAYTTTQVDANRRIYSIRYRGNVINITFPLPNLNDFTVNRNYIIHYDESLSFHMRLNDAADTVVYVKRDDTCHNYAIHTECRRVVRAMSYQFRCLDLRPNTLVMLYTLSSPSSCQYCTGAVSIGSFRDAKTKALTFVKGEPLEQMFHQQSTLDICQAAFPAAKFKLSNEGAGKKTQHLHPIGAKLRTFYEDLILSLLLMFQSPIVTFGSNYPRVSQKIQTEMTHINFLDGTEDDKIRQENYLRTFNNYSEYIKGFHRVCHHGAAGCRCVDYNWKHTAFTIDSHYYTAICTRVFELLFSRDIKRYYASGHVYHQSQKYNGEEMSYESDMDKVEVHVRGNFSGYKHNLFKLFPDQYLTPDMLDEGKPTQWKDPTTGLIARLVSKVGYEDHLYVVVEWFYPTQGNTYDIIHIAKNKIHIDVIKEVYDTVPMLPDPLIDFKYDKFAYAPTGIGDRFSLWTKIDKRPAVWIPKDKDEPILYRENETIYFYQANMDSSKIISPFNRIKYITDISVKIQDINKLVMKFQNIVTLANIMSVKKVMCADVMFGKMPDYMRSYIALLALQMHNCDVAHSQEMLNLAATKDANRIMEGNVTKIEKISENFEYAKDAIQLAKTVIGKVCEEYPVIGNLTNQIKEFDGKASMACKRTWFEKLERWFCCRYNGYDVLARSKLVSTYYNSSIKNFADEFDAHKKNVTELNSYKLPIMGKMDRSISGWACDALRIQIKNYTRHLIKHIARDITLLLVVLQIVMIFAPILIYFVSNIIKLFVDYNPMHQELLEMRSPTMYQKYTRFILSIILQTSIREIILPIIFVITTILTHSEVEVLKMKIMVLLLNTMMYITSFLYIKADNGRVISSQCTINDTDMMYAFIIAKMSLQAITLFKNKLSNSFVRSCNMPNACEHVSHASLIQKSPWIRGYQANKFHPRKIHKCTKTAIEGTYRQLMTKIRPSKSILKEYRAFCNTMIEELFEYDTYEVNFEEWILQYSGNQLKEYREAHQAYKEVLQTNPKLFQSHVKTDEKIIFSMVDQKLKARNITAQIPINKVLMGPVAYTIAKMMKNLDGFGSGLTTEQRCLKFQRWFDSVLDPCIMDLDGKAYDTTQFSILKQINDVAIMTRFINLHPEIANYADLHSVKQVCQNTTQEVTNTVGDYKIAYTVEGTQASGEMVTSVFNTWRAMTYVRFIAYKAGLEYKIDFHFECTGDDTYICINREMNADKFIAAAQQYVYAPEDIDAEFGLGQIAKQFNKTVGFNNTEYISCIILQAYDNQIVMVRKPERLLQSTPWTYNNNQTYAKKIHALNCELVQADAISILQSSYNITLLQTYSKMLFKFGKSGVNNQRDMNKYNVMFDPRKVDINLQYIDMLFTRYGVTHSMYEELVTKIQLVKDQYSVIECDFVDQLELKSLNNYTNPIDMYNGLEFTKYNQRSKTLDVVNYYGEIPKYG